MASKKFDELIKQTVDNASQTISDVTFLYKRTVVPKSHYKKEFSRVIEQELDQIVNLQLLSVYVNTLTKIKKDHPKLFLEALICIDQGIKLGSSGLRPNELQALEYTSLMQAQDTKKSFLNPEIVELYKNVAENGVFTEVDAGQEEYEQEEYQQEEYEQEETQRRSH